MPSLDNTHKVAREESPGWSDEYHARSSETRAHTHSLTPFSLKGD